MVVQSGFEISENSAQYGYLAGLPNVFGAASAAIVPLAAPKVTAVAFKKSLRFMLIFKVKMPDVRRMVYIVPPPYICRKCSRELSEKEIVTCRWAALSYTDYKTGKPEMASPGWRCPDPECRHIIGIEENDNPSEF